MKTFNFYMKSHLVVNRWIYWKCWELILVDHVTSSTCRTCIELFCNSLTIFTLSNLTTNPVEWPTTLSACLRRSYVANDKCNLCCYFFVFLFLWCCTDQWSFFTGFYVCTCNILSLDMCQYFACFRWKVFTYQCPFSRLMSYQWFD